MDCSSAGLGNSVFHIGKIPSNIAKIDLRRNNISSLPSDNFTAVNNRVEEITLESNNIEIIEGDEFGRSFPMLKSLSFYQNKIRKIRKGDFHFMERLEYLDLGDNLIKTTEDQAFKKLENLENLFLDENLIETFSPLSFDGIGKVKVLKLSNNKLKSIEHEWINHLNFLEKLLAKSNKIRHVRRFNAAWQKSLRILDLSNNTMKYIPALPFQKTTDTTMVFGKDWYIDLQGNPVKCNCFHSALKYYTLEELEKVVCGIFVQCQFEDSIIKWNSGAKQRLKFIGKFLKKPICQEPLLDLRSFEVIANKVSLIHLQCTASGEPIPEVRIEWNNNETVSIQQNFSIATLYIQKHLEQPNVYHCVGTNGVGFSKRSDWKLEISPTELKNCTILEKVALKTESTEVVKDKLDLIFPFTVSVFCLILTVIIASVFICMHCLPVLKTNIITV